MDATARSDLLAALPTAYPIIDAGFLRKSGLEPMAMARLVAGSGIRIAQYRQKGDFDRAAFEEARGIVAELRRAGVCCIVNDRADIAMVTGADGVHVGQEDIPPAEVRRLVGPDMLLGYSTHSPGQAADEQCGWADYVAIGPVFSTSSKQDPDPVVGLDGVAAARRATSKPLVAIGGIKLGNCRDVLEAGADSVAAISAVTPATLAAWAALRR